MLKNLVLKKHLYLFLLFIGIASYLPKTFAQAVQKNVTLSIKNQPLKEVLSLIHDQTGVAFFYEESLLKNHSINDLTVTNQPLNKVLNQVLANTGLSFKENNGRITIVKINNANTKSSPDSKLTERIKGTITGDDGKVLNGVTIQVKGSKIGTASDNDGHFEINLPSNKTTLLISSLGYKSQEVVATTGTELNIQLLVRDNAGLDEVVVVGYAEQKKSSLTGAITTISGDKLQQQHGAGFNEKLQGAAPGLQISSGSGVEGGSVLVRLRGATSINAGNDPLYVIDGVYLSSTSLQVIGQGGNSTNPLADLNPNDIETIQVLKDANATAMYGSRGANGVILITTKRGSRKGKTITTFNSEYGRAHYDKLWDLVTGPQHADILNQAYINDGGNPATKPYANIDSVGTFDRLHLVFRTATQLTDNISISGGDEKTKFYLGGDFTKQQSILKLQDFQRLGFRANIDHTLNKSIQIGFSTSYSATTRSLTPTGDTGGILNTGLHTPTLTPIFKADGTYNNGERFNNPYILFANNNDHAYGKHSISNAYLKWKILPNLTFKSSWSLDDNAYHEFNYYNANLNSGKATNGSATDVNTSYQTWSAEQLLNYNKTFNSKNFLSVFVGNTLQKTQYESATARGTNFPSTQFTTISAAAITSSNSTGVIESGLMSYFGGANYNFDNKYILDVNVRTDASSRFGSKHQWGLFPSVGTAWRISNENFFKNNVKFVDDLKLKASLGWTGNQNIADFASLGLWSGGNNYQDKPGITPSQLANPDLKWETTRQWDIGLQGALLKNKLRFEVNYYEKSTYDLLLQVPIPEKSGFSSIYQNIGAVSNKGFEVELSSTNVSTKDFLWTSSFNVSHNINEITKLPSAFTQYNRNWVRLQQGSSMYSFWLYKQLYVDPKTGNAVYEDVNKDGKITTDDREIVGNAFPKYYGGLGNNFSYKNFDFNFFIYFSSGNKVFNMNRYFQESAGSRGTSWSMLASMLRAWQKPGDITDIPRITNLPNADGSYNHNFESSRFMEDGSFIRLRNVSLGYTLPKELTARAGIQKIRAYVNLTNLFTITKYSGADPEVNTAQDFANQTVQGLDFSEPPHPRTINFGINLTF